MRMQKIYDIKELAQEFSEQPQIKIQGKDVILSYDFEQEDGEYEWKNITFVETISYKISKMSCVSEEALKSYNSVSEVLQSSWLEEIKYCFRGSQPFEYKHYLIFFDDYGTYEFIAKNLNVDSAEKDV